MVGVDVEIGVRGVTIAGDLIIPQLINHHVIQQNDTQLAVGALKFQYTYRLILANPVHTLDHSALEYHTVG